LTDLFQVERFIEWQAIVLSPICPHVADYIWTEWLHKDASILRARWPISGDVDESGEGPML
jgi:leucyl-tRNA synthetase